MGTTQEKCGLCDVGQCPLMQLAAVCACVCVCGVHVCARVWMWMYDAHAKQYSPARLQLTLGLTSHIIAHPPRVGSSRLVIVCMPCLCRSDLGFRIVAEQVSHHPPVSAFHADRPGAFRFHGAIHPKLKFWGKSVEAIPKGTVCLQLLKLVCAAAAAVSCFDVFWQRWMQGPRPFLSSLDQMSNFSYTH